MKLDLTQCLWITTVRQGLTTESSKPTFIKSSWCKGKHATAVSVWRPLAKKSTVNQNQPNVISCWRLIVTVAIPLQDSFVY